MRIRTLLSGTVLSLLLAGCGSGDGDDGNGSIPVPQPTTTSVVAGVNPPFDTVDEVASASVAAGPYEAIDSARYSYDPATETVSLGDPEGAAGTDCAAWLRLEGQATIAGETARYAIYTYVSACGATTAANELTSLAVGLVADESAADFEAALVQVASMTGVGADAITTPATEAERDPALRAAMIALSASFQDGSFVPGVTDAEAAAAGVDECLELGGLAWNDWTQDVAGGAGPPAGESDGDYYRCKACHGWDGLGTDGGYARRSRDEGRANAGFEDPNNCDAPGAVADCTASRNVSTDPVFGTRASLETGWEQIAGRSWTEGKSIFDATDPWGPGTILGNRHPDLSASGVNAADVRPTPEQLRCLTAYLNHPVAWSSEVFAAIDVAADPVAYTLVTGADAARGEAFYNDRDQGNCIVCHGLPTDPSGGPFTAGPAGGIKAYLDGDGKASELAHKVLWGEPGTFMTRASMNAPTPEQVADLIAYLRAYAAPLAANDDVASTSRGVAVTIDVLANDTGEGRTIVDFDAQSTAGATIACADPECVYQPAPDFTGEDSFGYTISDAVTSDDAIVTVTVLPPPVVAADDAVATASGASLAIDVLANDTGEGLQIVDFDALSANDGTVNCSADACTYEPPAEFVGIDSFGYTVSDGVTSDSGTVVVTVTEAAVTATAVDDVAATENGLDVIIDVLANDLGNDLTISDFDAQSAAGATVTCSPANCTYVPRRGFTGEDGFGYTISDGVNSDVGAVVVTVQPGPAVVATADAAVTLADTSVVIDVLANDVGRQLEVVNFDDASAHGGAVSCTAAQCTYTPPGGFTGDDTFGYTVSDGLTSASAVVTVGVSAVAPPVVANDDGAQTDVDVPVSVNVLANDVGVGISIVDFDALGTAGGTVSCAGNTCTYTPPPGYSGADSFGYTASDGLTSDSAIVNVTVAVVAVADAAFTQTNVSVTVDVLANDAGTGLTISSADAGSMAGGVVACTPADCAYTPPLGFIGGDSFEYTVSDGLTSDSTTVIVTVRTAVVAVDDSAVTMADTGVSIDVTANDAGDGIAVVAFDAASVAGGVVLCVASDCLYTPPAAFTGEDSFTYTISDGFFSDAATVTVTVEPVVPVGDFETGRLLYDADCGACHSAGVYDSSGYAGNIAGSGNLLVNDLGTLSPDMTGLILSDQEILDLTAFLDDPSVIGR